jgi:dihydrofolate reductase
MIKSIFAVDYWGNLGYKGSLPWPHLKEDMKYFKEMTEGHVVVMGRKTWDDPKFPKPLPNRINYVITSKPLTGYKDVKTLSGDLSKEIKKLESLYPSKTIWIIGGAKIIEETKSIVDEAHVTHIKGQYRADTKVDLKNYLRWFRAYSACPSKDGRCNWTTYKNIDIFRA